MPGVRKARSMSFAGIPGLAGIVTGILVVGVLIALLGAAVAGAVAGATRAAPASGASDARCVRWYPDYCVPANRGNLDCSDLRVTPLAVEGADPFDFDEDLDGRGCEPV